MPAFKRIYLVLIILSAIRTWSQNPVNCYAKVTGISGSVLTLSNVNETYHSFEDGSQIIIMQMQDNVIGSNTTNAATFGNLGSIQSAGLFEIARIASHTESGSLPNTITLSAPLVNTYNTGANSSVQIISFRFMGANYTTTANIGTLPWNGNIGGVTALSVTSVFTLGHSISANGCGFTGGSKNTPNGYSSCDNSNYATTLATRYAGKGEGIYKRTNTAYAAARGKILNGGGGGNDVNAGGGGGGNYTSGGTGGSGWTPSGAGCSPIAGGLGGLSLSGSISGSRLFMGGGGGGGHENDGVGSPGAAGGGIILIRAGTLVTAACSGVSITANGAVAANAANDGAGGGGAGGSVIFNVGAFSIPGSCPLAVSANGGNGGNSNAAGGADSHGGGGGGGQGVVIYSAAQPLTNMTSNTIPGNGGVSCGSCNASQNGAIGSGTSNSGIITGATGPLPVELLYFGAKLAEDGAVLLEWRTAVEENSRSFVLLRLKEQGQSEELAHIPSKGSNSHYTFTDRNAGKGIRYYRLRQVDKDGRESLKPWVEINTGGEEEDALVLLYPNPLSTQEELTVNYRGAGIPHKEIELLNITSGIVLKRNAVFNNELLTLPMTGVEPGAYLLRVSGGNRVFNKKLIVLN